MPEPGQLGRRPPHRIWRVAFKRDDGIAAIIMLENEHQTEAVKTAWKMLVNRQRWACEKVWEHKG